MLSLFRTSESKSNGYDYNPANNPNLALSPNHDDKAITLILHQFISTHKVTMLANFRRKFE